AGGRCGPAVAGHGVDRGREVGGHTVVAVGDVVHAPTMRPRGHRSLEGTRRAPAARRRPPVSRSGGGTLRPVVRPVQDDARGIGTPDAGLRRFRLDRFPPSAAVARMVDRYWVGTWDLRGQPSHTQHVLAHPVVNVTFQDGGPGLVTGVPTAVS